MAKLIYSKREQIWILVPTLSLLEEARKGEFEEIDVFCLYCQIPLINKFLKEGGQEGDKDRETDYFKRESLIGLVGRIEMLIILAQKLESQKDKLISFEKNKDVNRVYDFRPHLNQISIMQAYLNVIDSIDEFCRGLDEQLKVNFWSEIVDSNEQYSILKALRIAIHHVGIPVIHLSDDNENLAFTFSNMDRIDNKKLKGKLSWLAQEEHHTFEHMKTTDQDSSSFWLNEWAKKHLGLIDPDETLSFIDEKRTSNGSLRVTKVSLKEVMSWKKK